MNIDLFALMGPAMIAAFIVPIFTTVVVIAVIVWAIRRTVPPPQDPAVAALKARFARGEIDPAEYQVRLAALQRED